MKYLFFLSGENLELAKEEILATAQPKSYKLHGRILIADCKEFNFKRLSFTHKVLKLIFISSKKDFEKNLKKTNWQKHYKKNFCVRKRDLNYKEKDIAEFIWNKLKSPKVKLNNSSTQIEFYKQSNKIICGILIEEIEKSYLKRKPHLRPGFHPSSMNPKLARACVNLSGIKEGKTLYDPFCGTGSMLIEAGLIGCKVIGSDISNEMLKKAEKNLELYKIKNYKLIQEDATKTKIKSDAIVTDPPYGKSSSLYKKEKIKLYEDFLNNAQKIMKKNSRLIIILPSKIKFKTKLKLIKKIDHYVHFSLTRRIYIFSKT